VGGGWGFRAAARPGTVLYTRATFHTSALP
jgi:hypothetical protein